MSMNKKAIFYFYISTFKRPLCFISDNKTLIIWEIFFQFTNNIIFYLFYLISF